MRRGRGIAAGAARGLGALIGISFAVTASAGQTTLATENEPSFASPRWGSFEASISGYTPRIDAEFGGAAAPYQVAFGSGRHVMVRADLSYSLLIHPEYGTLDVGLGLGFTQMNGHGLLPDGTVSGDPTRLRILPARALLTYRYEPLATRWGIPLVPFVRLTLDRYWWWTYNGGGNVANASGIAGEGATNGWSFSGGIAFLLNWIDTTLGRDLDRNTGINATYLFVEFTQSYINDLGSGSSWDLSNDRVTISGGLLFAF